MAKLFTYVMIITGITLLMKIAGFATGIDYFLNVLGLIPYGTTLSTSAFAAAMAAVLVTASASSVIIIGLFGRNVPEYMMLAPFTIGTLFIFIGDFAAILNMAQGMQSWIYYPILAVFGVLGVGFAFSAFEWTFGRD